MKILIAVRSDGIAESLSVALSGYDIHICATGADTLLMLDSWQPDCLILDLMLYDMDGITVLRKARYKPPIILALTNLVTNSILELAAASGVQDIILIPCTTRHIIKRLEILMEKAPSPSS